MARKGIMEYGDRNPWGKARALGLSLVDSQSDHLQCDLDSPEDPAPTFFPKLGELKQRYPDYLGPEPPVLFTKSASGNHHAYVILYRPVHDGVKRCNMQLDLGSDPTREALAIMRLEAGVWPMCLFETSTEFSRVVEFLRCGGIYRSSPCSPAPSSL